MSQFSAKATGKRFMEQLDPVEFIGVIEEGGHKFNEECDRLGISRVIELDGQVVLYHPDGSHTPIPDPDDRGVAKGGITAFPCCGLGATA